MALQGFFLASVRKPTQDTVSNPFYQRAQQSMIKQREPVGPDSMSRGFGLARSQIA